LDLRADGVRGGETAWFDRQAMQGFLRMMESRRRYEAAGQAASMGSNLLAWFSGGTLKALPPPLSAWTHSRHLPPFARKPFRQQWAERMARRKIVDGSADREQP
jgi:hypothetical protein